MASFSRFQDVRNALVDLPVQDQGTIAAAQGLNTQLTKPPGSLGRLEDLAIWYAGWRGAERPELSHCQITVFAGNHGIAARGVSAFPQDVTAQMVANFRAGGAAVNQLASVAGARLDVVALQIDLPTADFTKGPAMTEAEFCKAFTAGWQAVDPAAELFVAGEMGIGNTTAAAAISAALFGGDGEKWVGRGTGVDDKGIERKKTTVDEGLRANTSRDPIDILAALGGRETAAISGAILRARHQRIPVILDGFICTAAAAALEVSQKGALDHVVAGHVSAETAHAKLLRKLGKQPLLSLGMRLGEGSGAALAISVLRAALACHSGMATFSEAGVSGS